MTVRCKDADLLINKYMDGIITEDEAYLLNSHLTECEQCKQEFMFYDELMTDIVELPTITAPEGFEKNVMASIALLTEEKTPVVNIYKKIYTWVLGVFAVLFGLAFTFIINKEAILSYMYSKPSLNSLAIQMEMLSHDFSGYSEILKGVIINVVEIVNTTINNASGAIVFAIISLCAIQGFIIYRHRKIK